MMELFDSQTDFIAAFLSTLVHSFWIGCLLLLFLRLSLNSVNDSHSAFRYMLSKATLSGFFLIIIFVFFRVYKPEGGIASDKDIISLKSLLTVSSFSSEKMHADSSLTAMQIYAIRIYMAGLLIFCLRLILLSCMSWKKIKNGTSVEQKYMNLLGLLKKKLQISKKVRLIYSSHIASPALFGFLKPVIIVPAGMFSHLPFNQVEAILLHELIHLKKYDFIINIFQHILETLFFFNPFIWIISGIIRKERELRCDDAVILHCESPITYAKALFNVSNYKNNIAGLSVQADGNNKRQLLRRIQRLLKIEKMKKSSKPRVYLISLALLGLLTIVTLSGFNSALLNINKLNNKEIVQSETLKNFDHKQNSTLKSTVETNETIIKPLRNGPQLVQVLSSDDTIKEYNKQVIVDSLEKALRELKAIDWDEHLAELEKMKSQLLTTMPEELKEEQIRIQAELKNIDKEQIRKQLEMARVQIDSLKENMNMEELQKEIQLKQEELQKKLRENNVISKEIQIKLQEELSSLEDIDLEEIMENVHTALEDVDLDFDFDFDFENEINFDSLQSVIEISLEGIHMDSIRVSVKKSISNIEQQLKDLKEQE